MERQSLSVGQSNLTNTMCELKNDGYIEEEKKEFKDERDNIRSHYEDLSDTSAVDSQKFVAFDQISCSPEINDIFNDDRSEVNQNPDNDLDKKETNVINVKQD